MLESRWGRRLGHGVAALAGVLVIASTAVGPTTSAEGRPPPDCAGPPSDGRASGSPWFRLDPTVQAGRRTGQRLTIDAGPARRWTLSLDAESFATGPRSGRIVVGTDDGTRSTVRIVDTALGCASVVGTSEAVIRSAILSSDGRTRYEHRVGRDDRRDLGIWRHAGDGPATQVLAAPDADPAFGRTWLTTLHSSGRRLVVESCGEVACRFRELDTIGGGVRSIADPRLGSLVGIAGDALVTRGACRGLPCPVLRADLASGRVTTLAAAVGPAVLVRDGDRVLVVSSSLDGHDLRAVGLDGRAMALPVAGLPRPLAAPTPAFGVELPSGWVPLIGPDGPLARRLDQVIARRLEEVRP